MKKRLVYAIISGIFLILSFPPFGFGFLAWFAFAPLMLAVSGESVRRGLITGFVAGFLLYVGTIYWVVNSMHFYGGVPVWISVPVMLFLVAYLALYPALFCAFFSRIKTGGFSALVLFPALWVALEYIRAHILSGFPWILLGYSQVPYLPVVQMADVTGVWGVSFLVVLINVVVFMCVRNIIGKRPLPLPQISVAVGALIIVVGYGFLRISQVDSQTRSWRALNVAVSQGNIDQSVKWDPAFQLETVGVYRGLSKSAADGGAKIIVWPETAVPFFLGEDAPQTALVRDAARQSGQYILTGTVRSDYNMQRHGLEYFNSAMLIRPDGEFAGRYDKIHLVPFGEYVPLKKFLPFIKKLTAGVGDFSEGPGPIPIRFDSEAAGVLICYEAIFPEIARGAVNNGATFLVNITNDAWFGKTSAPYQHFEMTVLRSVENRISTVRSANTGISGFIDPVGRVVKKSGLFERANLVAPVAMKNGEKSVYTLYGDAFAYACLAFSGLYALAGLLRKRR